MAPFQPLAMAAAIAAPLVPARRTALPWVGAALVLHGMLLAALTMIPAQEPPHAPAPFAVEILAATTQEKQQPTPPQPRVEKRPAPTPPIPVSKTAAPTALTTQSPPTSSTPSTPPAVDAPATKNTGEPAPAAVQAVVQPRFDAAYLNNPAPSYPPMSRRLGETGKVLLRVHVLPSGQPGQVEIRTGSGFPRLDHAAMEAVSRWRFIPARQGNEAVAAWVVVPISFSLEN